MRVEQVYELVKMSEEYAVYRMPFRNLYDTLVATASRVPEKTAFIDDEREITYEAFLEEVNALASYFSYYCHFGIGTKVALMMINRIEFCAAFYAVVKIGAVAVLVNTKYSDIEVKALIDDSGCAGLVLDDKWQYKVEKWIKGSTVKHTLVAGFDNRIGECLVSEAILRGWQWQDVPTVKDEELLAVIMYTSGTTGKPKGASMTHFGMLQGLYTYAVNDNMDGSESTVLAVPLVHITGLNCVLSLFVFLGGTIILVPYFDAKRVLDLMTESKCNYFHAVATVFILLEAALDETHDLSCLKDALCGGGFIPRETIENFCKKAVNCRFHPVYGMTETAGAGTYFRGHCLDSDVRDSSGVISDNCLLKIVDDDDREVPNGRNGEICFKGAYIIREYLHGVGTESFTDGWLHSGDIGHLDGDGNLFIIDRKKDMINRGGEKVYSLEVEAAAMTYGHMKQFYVFAVKDRVYGEVPGAVIVPEEGDSVDIFDLKRYLRDRMAHYKVPVYYEIREELPTTATGKICKAVLRRQFDDKYSCS